MKHMKTRGIVAVRAQGADLATTIKALDNEIRAFKDRHAGAVEDLRAAVDQQAGQIAALRLNGTGSAAPSRGNPREEKDAIAAFGRGVESALDKFAVRADLSIGGAGGGDLTKGGATVFPAVSDEIMQRQFAQSAIARLARRVTIESGSNFQEPQDLGDVGSAWVGETDARPTTATADFALLDVPLHEVYANQKITQRMLDDSRYPLGDWLSSRIADKLARAAGAAFATGDGSKKPLGLTAYTLESTPDAARAWGNIQAHFTGVAGDFAASDPQDIIVDTVHSLQAHFRPNARWVMNSKTAGAVRKLKDLQGRFLWADSLAAGQPPILAGYPVELDEFMPDIGADAPAIWFGDFQQAYVIVERPGLRLLRDPFSDKPHVLFYAYSRVGGALQNSEAVKAIVFGAEA
jgi:HK97 family phage major capsid protein